MRRLVLLTVLAAALVAPAAALAVLANGSNDDGALSVKNGRGKVTLGVPFNGAGVPFNGAAVGRLAHGKIWIADPIANDGDFPVAWGCDNSPGGNTTDTTLVCSGDNLRFRVTSGKYKIVVVGRGIFLSVVGHGTVVLNGAGVRAKLVLGENISQAAQFAQSGNAQAGIVALSVALAPAMRDVGVESEKSAQQ